MRKGSDSDGSLSTPTSTVASKHRHSPYFVIPLAKVASPRLFSPPPMTVSAPSHSSCSRLRSASCCELTVPIPSANRMSILLVGKRPTFLSKCTPPEMKHP